MLTCPLQCSECGGGRACAVSQPIGRAPHYQPDLPASLAARVHRFTELALLNTELTFESFEDLLLLSDRGFGPLAQLRKLAFCR